MDRSTSSRPPRRQFDWNRPTARYLEDPRFIEAVLLDRQDNNPEESGNETLLEIFLDIPDFCRSSDYEHPIFDQFLTTSVLEKVRDGGFERPDNLSVWLHDTSHTSGLQLYNGAISLSEFIRLSKIRRPSTGGVTDANIRKIHIPNPSPETLAVLALSSSDIQIPAVKRLMLNYLTFDTAIGLRAPSNVANDFILEFHMPGYAWRSGQVPREDSRPTTNNRRLRNSTDVSFLSGTGDGDPMPGLIDMLHEFHTSICVTGWNVDNWTAVCLTDSFFDDNSDPNNGNTLHFYTKENDQFMTDAMSSGRMLADKVSVKDPREYFFLVIKYRAESMAREWQKIRFKMCERIGKYVSHSVAPTSLPTIKETSTRRDSTLATAQGESKVVQRNEEWIKKTNRLLTQLTIMLENNVRSWHEFYAQDIDQVIHQADEQMAKRIHGSITDITDSIDEMKTVLRKLKELRLRVDDLRQEVSLNPSVECLSPD
ncbi:hypothetical protein CSOJ01_08926 [Colletotrichum sojae]|uniref:Uncharacterized protein n=1 Tax=Colletotrichum sojae TaxID=2175907 RepID=A0A8H6MRB5_9PEZI|nr:hypothetical protein CSOJ01_08926 [Colletotrichum sojae]